MILPKSLWIKNFLSIGEAKVALGDQGLVLVEGVNKDNASALSNGSGKSSFVDAISWVLFGETARGATGDAVVNLKAGKGCVVELELEVDGVPYTIMRGRKHAQLKNRVQLRQGTHDLTLGTDKMTQQRINNLLGCSVETFNAAIYMGQDNMPDLPNMTDKALKAVLEEAMSLNKLDDALEVANERLKDSEKKEAYLRSQLAGIDKAIDRSKYEIDLLSDQHVELKRDIANIQTEMREWVASMTDRRIALLTTRANLESELKTATVPKDNPQALLAQAQIAIDLKQAKLNAVNDRLAKSRAEVVATAKAIERTEAGVGDCSACGQALPDGDEAAKHVVVLRKQLDEQRIGVNKLLAVHDKLYAEIKEDRFEATQQYSDACLKQAHIRTPQVVRDDLEAVEKNIAQHDANQKERFDRLQDQMESKQDRADQTKRQIDTRVMEVVDEKARYERVETQLKEVQARMEILGKVKHALGRKGFRGEVLDQVTPYLNARTQHYLDTLSDETLTAEWSTVGENSDGDYTENFHIKVRDKSGVDRFANLSGGEKRKVRLSCALALQDLVATRAVKPIKLFIADEIDDAIDGAGLELLMGLLEAKAREVGSVFIISHNDLADWCRNKITVTKEHGVSTFVTP